MHRLYNHSVDVKTEDKVSFEVLAKLGIATRFNGAMASFTGISRYLWGGTISKATVVHSSFILTLVQLERERLT